MNEFDDMLDGLDLSDLTELLDENLSDATNNKFSDEEIAELSNLGE